MTIALGSDPRVDAAAAPRSGVMGAPTSPCEVSAPALTAGTRIESEYRPPVVLDLRRTVGYERRGPGDPTMVIDGPVIWRASRTPEGIATIALRQGYAGAVRAAAWGPGAAWAIDQVPALCGARDDPSAFDPGGHSLVRDAHHQNPGLRLGRTDIVFDTLASAIMEQKVTAIQAFGAWRYLVTHFGDRAPGPTPRPMFAPPTIEGWRHVPSWSWHRAGLEPPQARTIVSASRRGGTIARVAASAPDGDAREAIFTSLRGVGAWTSAEVRIRAFGDPDAVSVGDYHLAHEVGYALTGHRVDDDGMLALLAPWAGQRQRLIRLLAASGVREPRRGPRLHPEDHRNR